jgi:hypothetical protein
MTENGRDTQTRQCGAAEVGALAYRGEMFRSTVWRTRLDTTTNWAVVTTGIARSGTFSSVQAPSNVASLAGAFPPWCLHGRFCVFGYCGYSAALAGKAEGSSGRWLASAQRRPSQLAIGQ